MSCPACGNEHKLSERIMTEKEEAVIEAAKAAADTFRRWESLNGHGWDNEDKIVEALRDVSETVRALTATQPVRPEDVPPGTRFRFATAEEAGPILIAGRDALGPYYISTEDKVRSNFFLDDRIIPLQDEE